MKRKGTTRKGTTIPPPPGVTKIRYRPATQRELDNLARFMNDRRVHAPKHPVR